MRFDVRTMKDLNDAVIFASDQDRIVFYSDDVMVARFRLYGRELRLEGTLIPDHDCGHTSCCMSGEWVAPR